MTLAAPPQPAPSVIVFDLDGTLVETHRDIAASLAVVRAARGLPPLALEDVPPLLGWGVEHLLAKALQIDSPEEIAVARVEYAAHHEIHCTDHARVYPGVVETLGGLRRAGVGVGLLSNKPHRFCVRLLDALELTPFFHSVFGADAVPWKKPDPRGLLHAVATTAAAAGRSPEPDRAFYVGDSAVDIETARAAGTGIAFVRTGYGRIESQAPDFTWDSMSELLGAFDL